jgi:hypothetical protein
MFNNGMNPTATSVYSREARKSIVQRECVAACRAAFMKLEQGLCGH